MVIYLNIIRYVIFHISYDEWYILYHMRHINYDITERFFRLHLDSAYHQLVACDITIPSISDACLEKSFKNFWRSSPELSSISLWLLQAAPNFAFRTEIKISPGNRYFSSLSNLRPNRNIIRNCVKFAMRSYLHCCNLLNTWK